MFWGTIGGRGTPAQTTPPASGADFASSLSTDFSTGYVTLYDATVLLVGTDNGSSISSILSASFGQAASTLPRFTGDQVSVSSTINFAAGTVVATANFTLAQIFNPTFANGYMLAFFTSTGVNYRILVTPSAMLTTASTLTSGARLEFRWGAVNGLASTLLAGGVTTFTDNGSAGSNQSAATIPTGTYTSIANKLMFLEKIAVVP